MDKNEMREKKQQMVESARAVVADIRSAGVLDRAKISAAKDAAIAQITQCSQQASLADAQYSAQREELIRRLGDAAKSCDLQEMQRLKQLLDDCRPENT